MIEISEKLVDEIKMLSWEHASLKAFVEGSERISRFLYT